MASLAQPEIPETIKDSAYYSNTPNGQEENMEASYRPYVESGLKGIIASPYVAGAAVLSTVGGLLFGTHTVNQSDSLIVGFCYKQSQYLNILNYLDISTHLNVSTYFSVPTCLNHLTSSKL